MHRAMINKDDIHQYINRRNPQSLINRVEQVRESFLGFSYKNPYLRDLEKTFARIERTYQLRGALKSTQLPRNVIPMVEEFLGGPQLKTRTPKETDLGTYVRDNNISMIRRLLLVQQSPLTEAKISHAQLQEAIRASEYLGHDECTELLRKYPEHDPEGENPYHMPAAAADNDPERLAIA